jgi:exopolyphosphatase/guanosine-5'-triphosphate,3'-diphosphate pyrophosphatase
MPMAIRLFNESEFADILDPRPGRIIVVGGSAVAIAAILADLKEFSAAGIQGYVIQKDILTLLLYNLGAMTVEKRQEIIPFDSQRADIIVGGGSIMLAFMQVYNFQSVEISTNGLRHGYLLELFGQLNA